jgi:hypothetical protein
MLCLVSMGEVAERIRQTQKIYAFASSKHLRPSLDLLQDEWQDNPVGQSPRSLLWGCKSQTRFSILILNQVSIFPMGGASL